MATIVNLVAKLSADVSQFKAQMGTVPGLMNGAKAAIGGFVGSVGLGAIVKASLDSADALNDLLQKSQLSAELGSGLAQGMKLAGTSMQTLNAGVVMLSKNAELAAQGNKKMAAQFDVLGVSAAEFAKLGADEQLRTYVDALSKVEGRGAKVLNITRLMGGAAKDLLPAFADGAAGLDKMIDTAKRSNQVLSGDQVQAAAAANDAIDLLNDSFTGLIRNLALNFAPAITTVANGLSTLVGLVGPVIKSVVESVLQIGTTLGGVAALIAQVSQGNFAGAAELLRIEKGDLAPTTRGQAARAGDGKAAQETAKNTAKQLQKQDELIRAVRGGVPAVAQ